MKTAGSLAAVCLVLCSVGASADAQENVQVTPATSAAPDALIDLERWRTRWVMHAKFAGGDRKLLFDTGGGLTLLHPDVLAAADCKLWGRITGFRMFGERGDGPRCNGMDLTVSGLQLRPPILGAINLGKINPADAELDGIASLNMFEGRVITLNLGEGEIIVESPSSFEERIQVDAAFPDPAQARGRRSRAGGHGGSRDGTGPGLDGAGFW
ncbi:hypothetical protein [Qipengyuania sp. MTN3-11]|uniref:hypothetical protein n=1 Tax=Qipengyuania sp. MTN3-11 TaxID=3056557 RepID=UPI0036F2295D